MLKFSITVTFERHGALSFMNHISPFHVQATYTWIYSYPATLCSDSLENQLSFLFRRGILQKHLPFSAIAVSYFVSCLPRGWRRLIAGESTGVEGAARRGGEVLFRWKVIFLSQCEWSFWQFRTIIFMFLSLRGGKTPVKFSSHKSHLAVYALCSIILWV